MDAKKMTLMGILLFFLNIFFAYSQQDKEYSIYQFPRNKIPRIDGKFFDWKWCQTLMASVFRH